ncbi:MAG: type II secretion system protein [Armatimonadota bacterium]
MTGKRSGFTLIELLVVIAIIAILAAILFPVFAKAKESANTTACLNNLKQLGNGFRMYLDDWGAKFPGSGGWGEADKRSGWVGFVSASTGLPIYGPVTGTYRMSPQYGSLFSYVKADKVYVCPSDSHAKTTKFGLSYSLNSNLSVINGVSQLETSIRRPARTVLLIDEGQGSRSFTVTGRDGSGTWSAPAPIVDGYFGAGNGTQQNIIDKPQDAHNGGLNFAYCDGHAGWVHHSKYKDINYLPDPRH